MICSHFEKQFLLCEGPRPCMASHEGKTEWKLTNKDMIFWHFEKIRCFLRRSAPVASPHKRKVEWKLKKMFSMFLHFVDLFMEVRPMASLMKDKCMLCLNFLEQKFFCGGPSPQRKTMLKLSPLKMYLRIGDMGKARVQSSNTLSRPAIQHFWPRGFLFKVMYSFKFSSEFCQHLEELGVGCGALRREGRSPTLYLGKTHPPMRGSYRHLTLPCSTFGRAASLQPVSLKLFP